MSSTYYGWPSRFPDVLSSVGVGAVMKHPLFDKAKRSGDVDAANQLVSDLANREGMRLFGKHRPHARIIVVAAPDSANQIPGAFARLFAAESGLPLDSGVLKANSPKHTGRSAVYRFLHRASFDGKISTGANYLVLDDVMTQGGTISELRQWLQRQGSRVVMVATLAYTQSTVMSNGRRLAPELETLRALEAKHGRTEVSNLLSEFHVYGGNVSALTESEARMILKYQTLNELRNAFNAELANAQAAERSEPEVAPLPSPVLRQPGRRIIV